MAGRANQLSNWFGRFVSRERQQAVEGLDRVVQLLKEAVSLGIEEEMERYYHSAGARAAGDEGAAADAVKDEEEDSEDQEDSEEEDSEETDEDSDEDDED